MSNRRRLPAALIVVWALTFPEMSIAQSPGPATGPQRVRIAGQLTRPRIPDVPRDQVICFCLYTVHNGVLKLTAQLYPLRAGEARTVNLEVREPGGEWKHVMLSKASDDGWCATFRVEGWDASCDVPYRVVHPGGSVFEGLIRRDPVDKEEIVLAAFTGNSNRDRGPRPDIIANIRRQDPDLLFFSGDQVYDHRDHTASWLIFGTQFRDIIRDRPTICVPDDHDVGQPNLWGQGGKIATRPSADDGGYVMPPGYVNMVQRAQTANLPDPYDPRPIGGGIGVYYTALRVGGVDFGIIEDRKWKTGPAGVLPKAGPRTDHITDPNYDRKAIDVPEAELLGQRQLRFLREWGQNWAGVEMKCVLSQTIFAGAAHLHGRDSERVLADLDSNGWPQSGRDAALRELRRCFALHVAGDQHLSTLIHYGINDWEDAGWAFCVPSIVNYYARWFWPLEEPLAHDPASPLPWTGRYYDGFGNKMTVHAYANPTPDNHNAAGYGLVRFNKRTREITMECWPRHVDVSSPDARQFPGWPVTIRQTDNYGRRPFAWLPTLEVVGDPRPVVQVIDEENGEPVYTMRWKTNIVELPVFRTGRYTIRVGEGEGVQTLRHVDSRPDKPERAEITIDLKR